ncbi:MAG: hypothetical protein TYPL_3730 [Candidatus Tyloplasma litorale]|nr:MAG: hypothetical protein TYPL_3730 [Mycoplasmatales bacterium]
MKFDLEKYIIDKIYSNEWKINSKIPIEQKLIEKSNLSKMTVRKVIDKLKEREILYTIKGKGTFVSSFYKKSKMFYLSEIIGATKVIYLPSSSKIPSILLNKVNKEFQMDLNEHITFVKLYFINDEIVAYSINWLNNMEKKYSLKQVISGNVDIHSRKNFNKVINMHKLEIASLSDKNILLNDLEYIPTTYSYYLKKDRNVAMMRVTKVKPKYFSAFEVKWS